MFDALIVFLALSLLAMCGLPIAASLGKKGVDLVFYSALTAYSLLIYFVWVLSLISGFSSTTVYGGCLALLITGALFKPKGLDFSGHVKRAYLLPIFILVLLLAQRYLNANQGVDWQDLTIIGSIMSHGAVPPANNWLPNTATTYQYGYHLFVAAICALTGVGKAVAVNVIVPVFVSLLLLGVYCLTSRLCGKLNAGVYAQVLSISGSLIGPLFLLYLLQNPFASDEGLWTLGKIPLPFDMPDRVVGHAQIVDNLLSTGVNLPAPSTYFLSGTAFTFSLPIFVFAVALLLDKPDKRNWALICLVLASLMLVYPFSYVLLAAGIILFAAAYLYRGAVTVYLPTALVASAVLTAPRILDSGRGMWLPYLDTYSLSLLAVFFGVMGVFFLIGVAYAHKTRKYLDDNYLICFSIIFAAFLLISTIFPLQQGIADRKHLVDAWLLMSAIAGVGVVHIMERFGTKMRVMCTILLALSVLSPAMMLYFNLTLQPKITESTLSDFPAWQSNIQRGNFDGLKWIMDRYPAEYAAAAWVKENTPEDATFLEAPVEKYKFTPILPVLADRAVYVGWYGFLNQQGYSTAENVRAADFGYMKPKPCEEKQCTYELPTVDYIWFGDTERTQYGYAPGEHLDSRLIDMWDLNLVYDKEGVEIYEVP